jgi:hypothetical protein
MPRRTKADQEYLVAKFPDSEGVEIALLSEEECRARGIEPGRFPPRETWRLAIKPARIGSNRRGLFRLETLRY